MDIAKNTLIVLASDNGPTDWKFYYEENFQPPGSAGPFRGRKWSLYEGGIRESFIVRWPVKIPAGRINQTTVVHATDLFPTLVNLSGLKLPNKDFDGQDMSRAIKGERLERK